jgi:NADP-dependent 3-hydroxy acid dehydrogenase YdfG
MMLDLFFPAIPERRCAPARVNRISDVEPKPLTARQLAQKKYRESAKGRAAASRHNEKRKRDPKWRARNVARVVAWRATHRDHVNVLRRVQRRRLKIDREMNSREVVHGSI